MCIFCGLLKKNNDPSLILRLSSGTLYLNYSQTYLGRVMYVSNKHLQDFSDLYYEDDEWVKQFWEEIRMVVKTLQMTLDCSRVDIASLGNEVPHLHFHLIPRYSNETNFHEPPWPHLKKIISRDEQVKMSDFLKTEFLKMWPNFKLIKSEVV